MHHSLFSFTGLFLFIFLACNSSSYKDEVYDEYAAPTYAKVAENFEASEVSDKREAAEVQELELQRKIVKRGYLIFETNHAQKTHTKVIQAADQLNAYISDDKIYTSGSRLEYVVEFRVPSKNFETLLEQISGEAVKIDNKNITAQDVTEEFIDVESRIKTKKELENRYLQILQKAQKVNEILEVERELGNLRADIESTEGRLNYLKNRISFSTLTITFYEIQIEDFGFFRKLGKAIYRGWQNFMWAVLGLAHLWPFILLVVLLMIIIKIRKNKKS